MGKKEEDEKNDNLIGCICDLKREKKDMTFTLNAHIIIDWFQFQHQNGLTQIKSSEDGYVCFDQACLGLFERGRK